MRNSNNLFIDVERFAELVEKHPDFFNRKGEDQKDNRDFWGADNTAISWKCFEKLSESAIENINEYLTEHPQEGNPFTKINIADFILCINMAKDHHRGSAKSQDKPISSTGKKVLMMLLLGRIVTDDFKQSKLVVTENEKDPLYSYLSSFAGKRAKFYYFPGRTVSKQQLIDMVEDYENKITPAGIEVGLKELVKRGLVVPAKDKEDKEIENLFKLNFEGCEQFLKANKTINI